jgi:hypothetical protein
LSTNRLLLVHRNRHENQRKIPLCVSKRKHLRERRLQTAHILLSSAAYSHNPLPVTLLTQTVHFLSPYLLRQSNFRHPTYSDSPLPVTLPTQTVHFVTLPTQIVHFPSPYLTRRSSSRHPTYSDIPLPVTLSTQTLHFLSLYLIRQSTSRHYTTQISTLRHFTTQRSTSRHYTTQRSTSRHYTTQRSTSRHYTTQRSTSPHLIHSDISLPITLRTQTGRFPSPYLLDSPLRHHTCSDSPLSITLPNQTVHFSSPYLLRHLTSCHFAHSNSPLQITIPTSVPKRYLYLASSLSSPESRTGNAWKFRSPIHLVFLPHKFVVVSLSRLLLLFPCHYFISLTAHL